MSARLPRSVFANAAGLCYTHRMDTEIVYIVCDRVAAPMKDGDRILWFRAKRLARRMAGIGGQVQACLRYSDGTLTYRGGDVIDCPWVREH